MTARPSRISEQRPSRNYAGNNSIEWSWNRSCPYHQTCSYGDCVCDNECYSGTSQCDSQTKYKYWQCEETSEGCWYWDYSFCPSNQNCYYYSSGGIYCG